MALILVADDTPDILQMVKDIIEMMGHQVIPAADGVQMIEKAKSYQPKLIIADVMMPGAYGSAAYKALQEDDYTKKIPVVFLTAITPDQANKIIPKVDNVKVLHKPVDMPTLMAAVNELLPQDA
jgi:CheY-like chemotaxis protein